MERIIKQMFLDIDVIGPHVRKGRYDLIDGNREIILPLVWDHVIKPDMSITMHMWPLGRLPLRPQPPSRPRFTTTTTSGHIPPPESQFQDKGGAASSSSTATSARAERRHRRETDRDNLKHQDTD